MRTGRGPDRAQHVLARVATTVMRRPVVIGGAVIAVLLVLGIAFLHVTFGTPGAQVLPASTTSRQVAVVLHTDYSPAVSAPIDVVLDGQVPKPGLAAYAEHLRDLPNAGAVQDVATRDGAAYLRVTGPSDAESAAALQLVRDIRAVPAPRPSTALVGGSAAALIDTLAAVSGGLPWALLSIALTTLVLLFLFTGSVVLPIKGPGPQRALADRGVRRAGVDLPGRSPGRAARLHARSDRRLDGPADLLHRLRAVHGLRGVPAGPHQGGARRRRGHRRGCGLRPGSHRPHRHHRRHPAGHHVLRLRHGTAQVSFIQLFGIGTGIAIAADATVIRGLLVPAFMRLAGPLNWWSPPVLRRLYRRIGLAETARPTDQTAGRAATNKHPGWP